jgi:hypothetical protein
LILALLLLFLLLFLLQCLQAVRLQAVILMTVTVISDYNKSLPEVATRCQHQK